MASCEAVSSPHSASRAASALKSAPYRFRLPVIGSVLHKGEPSLTSCPIFRGHLKTERLEVTVRRRATGWEAETIAGLDAELPLPEISVTIPLAAIYAR